MPPRLDDSSRAKESEKEAPHIASSFQPAPYHLLMSSAFTMPACVPKR